MIFSNQNPQKNTNADYIRTLKETISKLEQEFKACKETEVESAKTVAFWNGILEASLAGIYVINNGLFSYVNKTFADMFGYASPEEIVGKIEMVKLVAPESRDQVVENVRKRIDN